MAAATYVHCYLRAPANMESILSPEHHDQFQAYANVIWGVKQRTGCKSGLEFVIQYGDVPFLMMSCLQKCVLLISTEAEYVAMSDSVRNIVLMENILNELRITQRGTLMHQHNAGAIDWTTGRPSKQLPQAEQNDIRHSYVIDLVKSRRIVVIKVFTDDIKAKLVIKKYVVFFSES